MAKKPPAKKKAPAKRDAAAPVYGPIQKLIFQCCEPQDSVTFDFAGPIGLSTAASVTAPATLEMTVVPAPAIAVSFQAPAAQPTAIAVTCCEPQPKRIEIAVANPKYVHIGSTLIIHSV